MNYFWIAVLSFPLLLLLLLVLSKLIPNRDNEEEDRELDEEE